MKNLLQMYVWTSNFILNFAVIQLRVQIKFTLAVVNTCSVSAHV